MICPDCGYENIDGEEWCAQCEQPLVEAAGTPCTSEVERRILRDTIRRLAPREPVIVAPETPVGEVLKRLVDRQIGCAVVVSGRKVAGIFTERDVLLKLNVRAAELSSRPVSEFMTSSVETLELDDRIAFALHKMDVGGYRHIPILQDGRVMGIISVRRILNHITGALGTKAEGRKETAESRGERGQT
jgi:CBS domain-containing protein